MRATRSRGSISSARVTSGADNDGWTRPLRPRWSTAMFSPCAHRSLTAKGCGYQQPQPEEHIMFGHIAPRPGPLGHHAWRVPSWRSSPWPLALHRRPGRRPTAAPASSRSRNGTSHWTAPSRYARVAAPPRVRRGRRPSTVSPVTTLGCGSAARLGCAESHRGCGDLWPDCPPRTRERGRGPCGVDRRSLFGRERELAEADVAIAGAAAGTPQVVLLGGEAGIGKSRLVREIGGRAGDPDSRS